MKRYIRTLPLRHGGDRGDPGPLSIQVMVEVRAPRASDAPGVGRAWEDARQFYSDLDSRAFLPPDPSDTDLGQALLDRLLEANERPDRLIRVAELDGGAVGFITATLHEPADESRRQLMRDQAERHAVIDALVVQRPYWQRGVGRALVEAVEDWAADAGASLVKLTTYADSPVSTAFYEALGFGRRAIVFRKYLSD